MQHNSKLWTVRKEDFRSGFVSKNWSELEVRVDILSIFDLYSLNFTNFYSELESWEGDQNQISSTHQWNTHS